MALIYVQQCGVDDNIHHLEIFFILRRGEGEDFFGGSSEEPWPSVNETEVMLATDVIIPMFDGGWTGGYDLSDSGDAEVVYQTTISYVPFTDIQKEVAKVIVN